MAAGKKIVDKCVNCSGDFRRFSRSHRNKKEPYKGNMICYKTSEHKHYDQILVTDQYQSLKKVIILIQLMIIPCGTVKHIEPLLVQCIFVKVNAKKNLDQTAHELALGVSAER